MPPFNLKPNPDPMAHAIETVRALGNVVERHDARLSDLADRVKALEAASRPAAHTSATPEPRSPAGGPEKPLADEVLADLRDLLAEFAAEIERLEGVVEQQRLVIIDRDNEIRAYKERESRDLEDARKWRELVERVRDDG